MAAFEYEAVDDCETAIPPTLSDSNKCCKKSNCLSLYSKVVVAVMTGLCLFYLLHTTSDTAYYSSENDDYNIVMHISDTHIDPLFDPTMSMQAGVCHTCDLSTSVYGKHALCPDSFLPDYKRVATRSALGYAFGRYGCNPPHLLWKSLYTHMKTIDPDPKVIVFTGDISPHGYPDDNYKVTKETRLEDLCATKFLVTKHMVEDLVAAFPNTRWAYALGNNDHFPKNKYWQPYITQFGDMLLETGFFTPQQHHQFVNYGGSNYIDIDNVRYISLDCTLFVEGGEPIGVYNDPDLAEYTDDQYPMRHIVEVWIEESLADAQKKGLSVYIIGHQPLATKKGKDEYDVSDSHYRQIKMIFEKYADIIRVGLFGHRNLAGLTEVLSEDFKPLFPAITAPGISPRGNNQPSFSVIHQSPHDGTVLDFEQWKFNLLDENKRAQNMSDTSYLGSWYRQEFPLQSWRTFSGESEFTASTLALFLQRLVSNQRDFFLMEIWKRGGYVGDETPESYACKALYDKQDAMMKCLFPNQEKKCWSKSWLE